MALDPHELPEEVLGFLAERHLATLTTVRADGSPHVVAVGFTFDPEAALVRVITSGASRQVDGARWLALEGRATVTEEPARLADAVRRYAERYRQPGERDDRVAIEIMVDRVLGRA